MLNLTTDKSNEPVDTPAAIIAKCVHQIPPKLPKPSRIDVHVWSDPLDFRCWGKALLSKAC